MIYPSKTAEPPRRFHGRDPRRPPCGAPTAPPAAGLAGYLADLGADPQRAAQDEEWLTEEFNNLVADRLRRAGLAPERVRGIVEELQGLDLMTGIDEVLPGFDQAITTGFELRVTMPGAVTGGNADIIDGNVAIWKFNLMRTIGGPWTLAAESGS